MGYDDDAADTYNIYESDLIAGDSVPAATYAKNETSSSISSHDRNKIAYHLPAMGELTAGISHTDSGEIDGSISTSYEAKYTMKSVSASITLDAFNDENAT